jgi:hypothetical protein
MEFYSYFVFNIYKKNTELIMELEIKLIISIQMLEQKNERK